MQTIPRAPACGPGGGYAIFDPIYAQPDRLFSAASRLEITPACPCHIPPPAFPLYLPPYAIWSQYVQSPRKRLRAMTEAQLTMRERSDLRIFRQVVVEARAALAMKRGSMSSMRIVNGYVESDDALARVRALCIPVRRSYLTSDPVNFNRIIELVRRTGGDRMRGHVDHIDARFQPLREELASVSILNDRRVTHAEMFEAWIDAMVFFEIPDKVRRYERMLNELGKAVEGIGLHLCERIGNELLLLDDMVADFLGEPRADAGASVTAST